jgi:hypothetical protein
MSLKPNNKLPIFAPNLSDAKELGSLGIGNLLTTYENLVKAVNTKPTDRADGRPTFAAQLKAALPFLFAMASCQTRSEFASIDYDRALPKSERSAIAARASRLVDTVVSTLKAYDVWNGF